MDNEDRNAPIRIFLTGLFILVCILLIFNFGRKLNSGVSITFQSFLNWLSQRQSIAINVRVQDFAIYGDWGLFDGLRSFLNIFTTGFGVLLFFSANIVNIVAFLAQFIAFIFV